MQYAHIHDKGSWWYSTEQRQVHQTWRLLMVTLFQINSLHTLLQTNCSSSSSCNTGWHVHRHILNHPRWEAPPSSRACKLEASGISLSGLWIAALTDITLTWATQLEAHKAKQQLQHQFNESRSASQHSRALEDEIKTLQSELSVHRSHSIPDDNTQQATLQAQELSLALRRLSDKLDLTEQNLADCKERLSRAVFERDAAVDAKESVLDVLVDLRQELEKAKAENRELNYHT